MARARRVGVGELVDQRDRRAARQQRVEVHLAQRLPAIRDARRGTTSRPVEQRLGVGAAVRLDHADHDVAALGAALLRRLEHRVGLADARRRADEEPEAAALLARRGLEQRVGRGPARVLAVAVRHAAQSVIARCRRSSARFSSSTFTRGSPSTPSQRPSVCSCDQRLHGRGLEAALARHAPGLEGRRRGRDVRVEPASRSR